MKNKTKYVIYGIILVGIFLVSVVGTYYIKGGEGGTSFVDNAKIIYTAFGGIGCSSNPYTVTPTSDFLCSISNFTVEIDDNGIIVVSDIAKCDCRIRSSNGVSYCHYESGAPD